MSKPAKPSPDFPLFAHASGVWAKKINGKLHYFAPWHDPQGALRAYQEKFGKGSNAGRATALQPHRRRRATTTLQDACNTFLAAQETRKDKGEVASITFAEYLRTSQRLCAHLGKSTPLETLSPGDFASYRSWRAETCNLVSVGNETTRVRTIIKWAWKHFGIPCELNFGPDFRRPSAKALRRHRRLAGKKLFTPRQIRLLLDETGVHLHAMILLGINCGFGNTDSATMPVDAVNLDTGWIYYPRPKTEVEREMPLWPVWASDDVRRQEAKVPPEVMFATKPQLAREMLARALYSKLPATLVTADEVYGSDHHFRTFCESRRLNCVVAISSATHLFLNGRRCAAGVHAAEIPALAWQPLSCGAGAKGQREYDWALVSWPHHEQETHASGWLVRRSLTDPTELAFYFTYAPRATPLDKLVAIAGCRWAIEEGFEQAKQETGLDEYEVRSWIGWHRHVTLSLLAHATLAALRARAAKSPTRKKSGRSSR